jgi:hypothetical protein
MSKQVFVDNQTRISIAASVAAGIALYYLPNLGMAAIPVLLICVGVAVWGAWPLILWTFTATGRYPSGPATKHAFMLGLVVLGIGIGGLVSTGQYAFWARATDTGRIVWNYEETASGRGYFLNMQKPTDGEMRVVGFGAHGKNNSPEPITDFEGYIRSDITNETVPIYLVAAAPDALNICTPPANTLPKDTLGIPGFADFDIVSFEKPFYVNVLHEGPTLSKFEAGFVPFTLVLKYDGQTFKRRFTKEEVEKQIALLQKVSGPITTPHVVRKTPPPPLTPPPLMKLVPPASPVPPGALKPASPNDDDLTTGRVKSD